MTTHRKGRIPDYLFWDLAAVLGFATGVAISIVGGSPPNGGRPRSYPPAPFPGFFTG